MTWKMFSTSIVAFVSYHTTTTTVDSLWPLSGKQSRCLGSVNWVAASLKISSLVFSAGERETIFRVEKWRRKFAAKLNWNAAKKRIESEIFGIRNLSSLLRRKMIRKCRKLSSFTASESSPIFFIRRPVQGIRYTSQILVSKVFLSRKIRHLTSSMPAQRYVLMLAYN